MSAQDSSPQDGSQSPAYPFPSETPSVRYPVEIPMGEIPDGAIQVASMFDMMVGLSPQVHEQASVGSYPFLFPNGEVPTQAFSVPLPNPRLCKILEEQLLEMKKCAWELFQARSDAPQRSKLEGQFFVLAWRAYNQRDTIIDALGRRGDVILCSNVSFVLPKHHDVSPADHFMMWLDHLTELIRSTHYWLKIEIFKREMERFFAFVRKIPHETRHEVKRSEGADDLSRSYESFATRVPSESVRPLSMHPYRMVRVPDDGYDASMVTVPDHLRDIPEVEEFINVIRELKKNRDTARREDNQQEADEANRLIEELRGELRSVIKSLDRTTSRSR